MHEPAHTLQSMGLKKCLSLRTWLRADGGKFAPIEATTVVQSCRAPPGVRRGLRHGRAHTAATVSHRALAATEADRIDRASQRGHRCGGGGRARYRSSKYGIR